MSFPDLPELKPTVLPGPLPDPVDGILEFYHYPDRDLYELRIMNLQHEVQYRHVVRPDSMRSLAAAANGILTPFDHQMIVLGLNAMVKARRERDSKRTTGAAQ